MATPKQQLLEALEREHQTTMNVLRAFPPDQADLRPHPKCKTAKELAWVFVLERGLGKRVMTNTLNTSGEMPAAPATFEEVVTALTSAHRDYLDFLGKYSDDELNEEVTFFVAPKTPGPIPRLSFAWFLLSDEVHHRGQFSIYLRMADGKVPSIYGPTADEPWF